MNCQWYPPLKTISWSSMSPSCTAELRELRAGPQIPTWFLPWRSEMLCSTGRFEFWLTLPAPKRVFKSHYVVTSYRLVYWGFSNFYWNLRSFTTFPSCINTIQNISVIFFDFLQELSWLVDQTLCNVSTFLPLVVELFNTLIPSGLHVSEREQLFPPQETFRPRKWNFLLLFQSPIKSVGPFPRFLCRVLLSLKKLLDWSRFTCRALHSSYKNL